jgi:hypothetical protein
MKKTIYFLLPVVERFVQSLVCVQSYPSRLPSVASPELFLQHSNLQRSRLGLMVSERIYGELIERAWAGFEFKDPDRHLRYFHHHSRLLRHHRAN